MSCNCHNRKNVKSVQNEFFYPTWCILTYKIQIRCLFSFAVTGKPLWSEENNFIRIIENIRYGGSISLRQAAMGLAQRLRCFTSYHAALQSALSRLSKLCFGQENLINSTLSAAGGSNTLALIGNWIAEVDFLSI